MPQAIHPFHRIEFSEMDEKDKSTTCYTLEKIGINTTKLTLDYFIEKNIANQVVFKLGRKKKLENTFNISLQNLVELVKEIRLPAID